MADLMQSRGEMRRLMDAHDWGATSLGPREGWPTSLRTMVSMVPSHLNDWVRRDPDLASLRQHPEFIRMFGSPGEPGRS